MSVTGHAFTKFTRAMLDKRVQMVTSADSIGVILLDSTNSGPGGTTDVQSTAEFVGDVLDSTSSWGGGGGTGPCKELATANGYTQGGIIMGAPSVVISGLSFQVGGGLTPPVWTISAPGVIAYYALFFDSTPGTLLTDPVIGWWDFGGGVNVPSGPLGLFFPVTGIFEVNAN